MGCGGRVGVAPGVTVSVPVGVGVTVPDGRVPVGVVLKRVGVAAVAPPVGVNVGVPVTAVPGGVCVGVLVWVPISVGVVLAPARGVFVGPMVGKMGVLTPLNR